MSEHGTIVFDRGIFGHPVFADEPFTEREAWTWLIAEAAYRPRSKRVGSITLELARGQLAHSLRFMASKWKWSESRVRRFLAKLQTESMILVKTDARATQLTVCNYDAYQPDTSKSDAVVTQTKEKEEEVVLGGGGDARAREATAETEPLISAEAFALTTDVLVILGLDPEFVPPSWIGAAGWFDAGIRGGWNPAVVRIAAQRVAAARRRRNEDAPWSYRYLEKPILREHENAAQPGPAQPQAPDQHPPLMRPFHGVQTDHRARPKSGITAAVDRRIAELTAAEQGAGGDEGGESPVRLLSHG